MDNIQEIENHETTTDAPVPVESENAIVPVESENDIAPIELENATIELYRNWHYVGCVRRVSVIIDGTKVDSLQTSDTQKFQVEPGFHTVMIKQDFVRSRKLEMELTPGQTLRLECGTMPFLRLLLIPPLVAGGFFSVWSASHYFGLLPGIVVLLIDYVLIYYFLVRPGQGVYITPTDAKAVTLKSGNMIVLPDHL